jgi:rod shape-determining protein MreC
MGRLFQFFYTYRSFFTFLGFEVICISLVIQNNQYQSSKYFNTSNEVAATIISTSSNVKEYFGLSELNSGLAAENARLREIVVQQQKLLLENRLSKIDSTKLKSFTYTSAKVVNNSVSLSKNYITINKGSDDGVAPGMAVISGKGIVGTVKTVSRHFSVVISILNVNEQVSSLLKSENYLSTSQWDGIDPQFVDLKYVPRHVKLHTGDTIVTSGYNAVFPEGILVGVVTEFDLKKEALFYDVRVKLAQDFAQLSYVDVIKSVLKVEKDSIENLTIKK